jgi:hypothetical protein
MLSEDRITVSGASAIRRHFTYQEQAHAQLTNEVVQIIFLVGERGFVMTLATALGVRQAYQDDFDRILQSFVGSAPGEEVPTPTKRKKIRSGEMVNPDGVPY